MKETAKKPVVVLQYLSYIHYRKSLFELLSSKLSPIDFHLICGDKSPYGVKSFKMPEEQRAKNSSLGPFIWQSRMLKKTIRLKPDAVILLGVNPFIISSFLNFWFLKIKGIKVIWWGHGTLGHQGKLGRWARLYFYKKADASFVYNVAGKKRLESYGIPADRVFSIGNCINLEDYGSFRIPDFKRTKVGYKKEGVTRFLFSGRLTKVKRLELLLQALAEVKNETTHKIELIMIGDGPEKAVLTEMMDNLKLNGIIKVVGEKYGEEAQKYFVTADFFIQPGSIGLAVFHALSYGLPVITHSNFKGQGPEAGVLNYKGNDWLVEEGSIESIKDKIIKSLELPYEEYTEVSSRCLSLAQENMPDSVFNSFTTAIHDIL